MKIITIASGKGGVGKTTLTANIGVALAGLGHRVLLIDADLGLANLDVALGVQSEITIQHAIEGISPLSKVAIDGPGGVKVVVGGSGVGGMLRLSRKRLEGFLDQVSDLKSSTDVLIFDCLSGADARVMATLMRADQAVLVTTPDPASVVDCYATAKVLFRYKPDASIRVLVNQVDDATQATKVYQATQSAAEKFLHKSVAYAGFVRNDPKAAAIARSRKAFVLTNPDLPASKDVKTVAADIVNFRSSREEAVAA